MCRVYAFWVQDLYQYKFRLEDLVFEHTGSCVSVCLECRTGCRRPCSSHVMASVLITCQRCLNTARHFRHGYNLVFQIPDMASYEVLSPSGCERTLTCDVAGWTVCQSLNVLPLQLMFCKEKQCATMRANYGTVNVSHLIRDYE